MNIQVVNDMPDDVAEVEAEKILAAHEAGRTVRVPNPHYQLRVAERFLASINKLAEQQHTTAQALLDEALEEYFHQRSA